MSVAEGSSRTFESRSIANASATIFAASTVLSVGGFVFHAIASRRLGVDSYGTLYALISLYSLAGLPVAIFSPVVTRYSAEFAALHDSAHVRGLTDWILRFFAILGAIYVAVSFVFAYPVATFFHVPVWGSLVVGVMLAIGIFSGAMRAIGQGVHAYAAFALSMAGEGVGKVIAVSLFAFAGLTTFGAIGAFVCGMAAGAVAITVPLVRRYGNVAAAPITLDWRRIFATIAGAAVLTLMMTFIGFADVLIVTHFFPAQQAGLYSMLSLCGKVLLYFVGFVPAILIPQATHRHARGERTRKVLWMALCFITVVSVVGIFAYRFLGFVLLHALAGHAFDAAIPLLPYYGGAMALLAMTNALGSYAIATHRLTFAVPLLATTLGTIALIASQHPTLEAVVVELVIGNVAMLLATAIPLSIQAARA